MSRVAVRGYTNGQLLFEERIEINGPDDLKPHAARHARTLQPYEDMMVEFEFLDHPGEDRFLRFGTDPSLMVMPLRVDLKRPN